MTAVQARATDTPLLAARTSPARRFRNRLATVLIWLSVAITLVPVVLLLGYLVSRGAKLFGWHFLVANTPPAQRWGGGAAPAVFGTISITGVAMLLAVPLGVLGAVYLHEYGGNGRLARVVRFLSRVMTGVPSVVMGLFVYTIWVLYFGLSGLAGSVALACLMLPIVIRAAEEMLRLVPDELRQASYALGARRSRTILTVVLPAALPGIVSGALLAVARAAGETAPVLFTIGVGVRSVDIHSVQSAAKQFLGTNTTLPADIYRWASTGFPSAHQRAFTAALTLVVIVVVFTATARLVASRFSMQAD